MRTIEGCGEIHLPLSDDNYDEVIYDIADFDIKLLYWRSKDGYNREPIFRLTPKEDEDDHE